jgi:hypothetical protein
VSSPDNVTAWRSFLKRLPAALIVATILWFAMRPALDTLLCRTSQTLIRAYEHPRVTRLVSNGHRAEVHRMDFRTDSSVPAIPLTEIHANTVALLALYLALKRPLSRRQLERLLMGWSLLLVVQTLNLVFHVKYLYATGLGEWSLQAYSDLGRNVLGFLRYFTDLPGRFAAPFLIWIGFNWQRVTELIGTAARESDR